VGSAAWIEDYRCGFLLDRCYLVGFGVAGLAHLGAAWSLGHTGHVLVDDLQLLHLGLIYAYVPDDVLAHSFRTLYCSIRTKYCKGYP
jgi:hypothetical protein